MHNLKITRFLNQSVFNFFSVGLIDFADALVLGAGGPLDRYDFQLVPHLRLDSLLTHHVRQFTIAADVLGVLELDLDARALLARLRTGTAALANAVRMARETVVRFDRFSLQVLKEKRTIQ